MAPGEAATSLMPLSLLRERLDVAERRDEKLRCVSWRSDFSCVELFTGTESFGTVVFLESSTCCMRSQPGWLAGASCASHVF